jgi:hypothetical protein
LPIKEPGLTGPERKGKPALTRKIYGYFKAFIHLLFRRQHSLKTACFEEKIHREVEQVE